LALSSFVVGTCELVVVGLLDRVAGDMSVSISTAGQLVTAYALGLAVGGPILAALTSRVNRRVLLLVTLVAFAVANVVTASAVGYGMLLAVRVMTGAVQGLFIGVASVVAAGLVPPRQRGQAMSMVFGGIAVSTVLGVPLGTVLGRALGWRAVFVAVAVLAGVALVCALVFVPAVDAERPPPFAAQARAAFAPRVLAVLAAGLLLLGGQFTVFTFMSPYLQRVAGLPGGAVSAFLLVYGIASAVGTFGGGRLADRSAATTLVVANALLIAALGLVYVVGSVPALLALALAAWGCVGFGLVPSLQLRVIGLAGSGGDLAATLGASAVNLGIAAGGFVGGRVVAGPGVHAVALAGTIVVAAAMPITWATRRRHPVESPAAAAPDGPAERSDSQALAAACHALCLVEAGKAASTMSTAPAGEPR